jgi:hypothetical protein
LGFGIWVRVWGLGFKSCKIIGNNYAIFEQILKNFFGKICGKKLAQQSENVLDGK